MSLSASDKHRLERVIDVALEIAKEDAVIIKCIREAYLQGDRDKVFHLAGQLAGVESPDDSPEKEERDTTSE